MIKNILVLGGGTAGFIAAIAVKRKMPHVSVRVVRSPDIGIIGVGEGSTQLFPKFFFQQLGLKPDSFYSLAEPTWKLGLRFIWGPRKHFHYSFSNPLETRFTQFPRNTGFYCDEEFANIDVWHALMEYDKALPRGQDGLPAFCQHNHLAFHMENKKLVMCLEKLGLGLGVEIIEGMVQTVEKGPAGVQALLLADGQRLTADLYVDASGFRSELLGRALEVPYTSYANALFTDRAVIGGWPRTTEIIKPYTTVETMDSGWCWQIEHEHFLNRGYVYSGNFISDDEARAEFLRKNPQVSNEPRIVKFKSGRYETLWKDNVVAVGNASGFVEPLEATSIQVIILQCRTLADSLLDSGLDPLPSVATLYNRSIGAAWDEIRDFLAVHYKFNTRLNTPFWKTCCGDTPLGGAQDMCDFYVENGPSTLAKNYMLSPNNPYNLEGYFAMLVGMRVPYKKPHRPQIPEQAAWQRITQEFADTAKAGFTVREALDHIRRPDWKWN